MQPQILNRPQLDVLAVLTKLPEVGEFYLAGGTALALRHGHRRSIDFDFFRKDSFDNAPLLSALDEAFGEVERMSSAKHTLYLRLQGVTTSFFRLPYPLLEPVEATPWGFGLASDRDSCTEVEFSRLRKVPCTR